MFSKSFRFLVGFTLSFKMIVRSFSVSDFNLASVEISSMSLTPKFNSVRVVSQTNEVEF